MLAHRFDHIGEWAAAVPTSSALDGRPHGGAPVAGRTCGATGGPVRSVTERIVAYDESGRTLAYEALDPSWFLSLARNRWHVEELNARRSRVSFEATIELQGTLGRLAAPLLRLYFSRLGRQVLDDLAYFVERGSPSPRKQHQQKQAGIRLPLRARDSSRR